MGYQDLFNKELHEGYYELIIGKGDGKNNESSHQSDCATIGVKKVALQTQLLKNENAKMKDSDILNNIQAHPQVLPESPLIPTPEGNVRKLFLRQLSRKK